MKIEAKPPLEALQESEDHFHQIVAQVQDYAIFLLDAEGRVTSWNVGAERINGYSAPEIIGKHLSIFYPPEARAQGRPAWELRKAVEHGHVEDEGWRVRKDGSRFWANVVLTALFDEEGHLRGYVKLVRDMTDHRQIAALQDADRHKNEFLAVLAHELRNPLSPIRNALHIMGQPATSQETFRRARTLAERQIEHMGRLLDDLLDVSRINRGMLPLRNETVDLAVVVRNAVDAVGALLAERRHRLSVSVPERSLWTRGDHTRLEQVLTNLLSNAGKYTDPGGHIWVMGERKDDWIVLRVRDNGVGIEARILPRIFDVFVQAERRLDRSVGGVGIGLTLVKKLVELHGGDVEVFSAGPGTGSEFVVRLPAAEGVAAHQDWLVSSESPRPGLPRVRILVVDDNVDAADSLAMLLELSGQEVRVAYDGRAALTAVAAFRPEVVLLDIGMPGMDGYEVARKLREARETSGMTLVAMTGWGQPEDRRRSKEAGFDHHLTKPADPDVVEDLIRNLSAKRGESPAA